MKYSYQNIFRLCDSIIYVLLKSTHQITVCKMKPSLPTLAHKVLLEISTFYAPTPNRNTETEVCRKEKA